MWRDQVNYFTRHHQISMFSFFSLFGQGQEGRWCEGSVEVHDPVVKLTQKIFLKIDSVPKRLLQLLNTRNVS